MRVKNRESERQKKEYSREPAGDFCKDIRRLRAENVFGHPAPESGAQALTLRALHQDHQDHEQRVKNVYSEQDIDQNGHRDGQYRQPRQFVNGGLGGAVRIVHRHWRGMTGYQVPRFNSASLVAL
jgi:hypothetical protein